MQQLVHGAGINALHGFGFGDQAFAHHVHRDAQRGLGGALAAAGLQDIQAVVFHREFNVLHVAVVPLQQVEGAAEFGEHHRHRLFHRRRLGAGLLTRGLGQILRRADAGHHVFTLGVDQIFAIPGMFAGAGIAGEGHAGGRGIAQIAEHHGLHVDSGAPVFGNIVEPAIGARPIAAPRTEHRADRAPQLFVRVLRERTAQCLLHNGHVASNQFPQIIRIKPGILGDALVFLGDFQRVFKGIVIEFQHHIAIHLDETAIAVPRKPRVATSGGEAFHGLIVQAEVEHRIHHARHRHARAGANGDEQRVGGVAEFLGRHAFNEGEAVQHLRLHIIRQAAAGIIIGGAHGGGDGQARGHGEADAGHFREVGALAAQQFLLRGIALSRAATEPEN